MLYACMARGKREEKRLERNKMMISVFIVLLMLMSGFAIYTSFAQNQNAVTDHGIRFLITADPIAPYQATIKGQKLQFSYTPSEADIPMSEGVPSLLSGATYIIFTFDPATADISNLQAIDLLKYDLSTFYGLDVFTAVTSPSSAYPYPVFSCLNATTTVPVVKIELSSDEKIIQDGACVRVQGNLTGLLQARDKIIYSTLGIYN